jgi:hypothetical protein
LEDFKGVEILLDLLDINRCCFQNNPSNSDPKNVKWNTISDQMKNNGFNDWSADKCSNAFNNALDLYKKGIHLFSFITLFNEFLCKLFSRHSTNVHIL